MNSTTQAQMRLSPLWTKRSEWRMVEEKSRMRKFSIGTGRAVDGDV
jgi:hypothetical protein